MKIIWRFFSRSGSSDACNYAASKDPLLHPDLVGLSQRQLADLVIPPEQPLEMPNDESLAKSTASCVSANRQLPQKVPDST
ncbi:hypothetical protein [Agrobacterium vitis]|uniref:hypothetical protein n=1 Tax=Agrobacterium vitis TaxID=373 RepID=UPI003D2721BD